MRRIALVQDNFEDELGRNDYFELLKNEMRVQCINGFLSSLI